MTFNSVIDACARAGRMDAVVGLLNDMRAENLPLDLITHSTIIKGEESSAASQSMAIVFMALVLVKLQDSILVRCNFPKPVFGEKWIAEDVREDDVRVFILMCCASC